MDKHTGKVQEYQLRLADRRTRGVSLVDATT